MASITLACDGTVGRCLRATRDLAAGEELFSEQPLFCVPLRPHQTCAHCLAQLSLHGPAGQEGCTRCSLAHYCSVQCRKKDAVFHRAECRRVTRGREWDETTTVHARLALRLRAASEIESAALYENAAPLLACLRPPPAQLTLAVGTDGYIAARVNVRALTVHGMIDALCGAEGCSAGFDMGRQLRTLRALQADGPSTEAEGSDSSDDDTSGVTDDDASTSRLRGEHAETPHDSNEPLLAALCRVQRNTFHQYCVDGEFASVSSGACFHLLTALTLNHSCAPNVVTFHKGRQLHARTIAPVKGGEPLLTSYLDARALLQPAHVRRAALRRTHAFECACSRCALTAHLPLDSPPLPTEGSTPAPDLAAFDAARAELELHAAACPVAGCKGLLRLPTTALEEDVADSADAPTPQKIPVPSEEPPPPPALRHCGRCGQSSDISGAIAACRAVTLVLRSVQPSLAALEAASLTCCTSPLHSRHSLHAEVRHALAMALMHEAVREGERSAAAAEETVPRGGEEDAASASGGASAGGVAADASLALLERALECLRKSLQAATRLLPAGHPNVAVRLVSFANTALAVDVRLAERPMAATAAKGAGRDATMARKDLLTIAWKAYERAEGIFAVAFGAGAPAVLACARLKAQAGRRLRRRLALPTARPRTGT